MLSIGIVGLPNAGKSSLFKALTREQVDIANFPFTTIKPNVGIVKVPDKRLDVLAKLSESKKVTPTAIKFLDIAGLIKGAHKGEGLGNEFLGDIKETDAILLVLRGFENKDIIHTEGEVDPVRDAGILKLEMIMKDLSQLEKTEECLKREAMPTGRQAPQNKDKAKELAIVQKWNRDLRAGNWRKLENQEQATLDRTLNLLSAKPIIAALNIGDNGTRNMEHGTKITSWAKNINQEFNGLIGESIITIDIKTETELADLSEQEAAEWHADYSPTKTLDERSGDDKYLSFSSLEVLIKKCYEALDLITFLTTGEDETRAWTLKKGTAAQQAAGIIHTDFEKNFIRAEVISYDELISFSTNLDSASPSAVSSGPNGSPHFAGIDPWQKAKEAGKIRLEGKEYIMQDGDVVFFRTGK